MQRASPRMFAMSSTGLDMPISRSSIIIYTADSGPTQPFGSES